MRNKYGDACKWLSTVPHILCHPLHVNYMLAVIVVVVITITVVPSKDKAGGQLVAIAFTELFNLIKSLIRTLSCSPISQLMFDPTRLSTTPLSSIRWPVPSFGPLESSTLLLRTFGAASCAEWFPLTHPDPLYPAFCPRMLRSVDHINSS